MDQAAFARLKASLGHLISRVDMAERRLASQDRRINHLTRSLDNLWIQHEKHGQNLLKLQGDYDADLVQPDPR